VIENPFIRLPPEPVIDALARWAYKEYRSWWPSGGDLCETVPCAYVDEYGEKKADTDEMTADEAEEQGWHIDFDPEWPGEEIARDEIRGKDRWGKWRTVDIVLRVEYRQGWGDYWAYTTHDKERDVITIGVNWARDENYRWIAYYHATPEEGLRHLRPLLVHEMTHWLDPGQLVLSPPPSPDELMMPWDRRAAEEAYLLDVGERRALARETFERMKQFWDQQTYYGRTFPNDLLQGVRDDWPHLDEWFQKMPRDVRRGVLADLGRAFYLWHRSVLRRARIGIR
jgi:hypothetical protein